MEYKKNQILEVEITDMSENGEGIGKVSGYTLFVKDAVIGDTVKARLTKVKKTYSYARVEEIISPSKHRIAAPCPINRQCGGCQLQTLDYGRQLEFKEAKVKNDLIRLGGFDKDFIESISEPVIGMENPYRYRNKAQYPVGIKKKTSDNNCEDCNIITGFYAGRTHSIIENDDCLIGCAENKEILNIITSYMNEAGLTAYDETTGKGLIRHILIRKGFTTGQIMVCLVVNAEIEKDKTGSVDKLYALAERLEQIEGMTSICANVNTANTNVIMGEKCITLWGSDAITDYIGDIRFKISPLSFFQVNPVQTKKLYEKALEYAALQGNEIVWDLYCGIGTISLFFARHAKKVYGVEIVNQAIVDAKENAKINNINNAEFITGAAEDIVVSTEEETIASENTGKCTSPQNTDKIELAEIPDIIVVDPPRKGCDEALLETILKINPSKIVYISCNPATLARDLKTLACKYCLIKFCPVDMFPQTVHVETVCLLSQLDK